MSIERMSIKCMSVKRILVVDDAASISEVVSLGLHRLEGCQLRIDRYQSALKLNKRTIAQFDAPGFIAVDFPLLDAYIGGVWA